MGKRSKSGNIAVEKTHQKKVKMSKFEQSDETSTTKFQVLEEAPHHKVVEKYKSTDDEPNNKIKECNSNEDNSVLKSKKKKKRPLNKDVLVTNENTVKSTDVIESEITNKITDLANKVKTKKVNKIHESSKNKKIIFTDDERIEIENKTMKPRKNKITNLEQEDEVNDEDINKFCDELTEEDNVQYNNWVELIEAKLKSNKNKS